MEIGNREQGKGLRRQLESPLFLPVLAFPPITQPGFGQWTLLCPGPLFRDGKSEMTLWAHPGKMMLLTLTEGKGMRVEDKSDKAVFVGGKILPSLTAILLLQGPGKSRLALVPARMWALGPRSRDNKIRGFQMLSRQDQDRSRKPKVPFRRKPYPSRVGGVRKTAEL